VIRSLRSGLAVLGFLTRLGPAAIIDRPTLSAGLPYFPLVGALLGLLACAPWAAGLFAGQPWIQAWITAVLLAWLTRFLHLDAICDLCDAAGPAASGERFWEIVKDSRAGAFGAAGIALVLAGQIVLLEPLLAKRAYGAVIHALALGRLAPLAFMAMANVPFRPGLGQIFAEAFSLGRLAAAAALTLAVGLAGAAPAGLALGWVLAGLALIPLLRLSRRAKAINGDFLGAAIVLAELAGLLGAAAAGS
jgi:adenosylcobinamide-GDP ribazoletransferase